MNPFVKSNGAYHVTGDYTLDADISGCDILVGRDAAGTVLSTTVTLTVTPGAVVTESALGSPGDYGLNTVGGRLTSVIGLNTFGDHHTNIVGGRVDRVSGCDSSTTTIAGGSVAITAYSLHTSSINVTGGSVEWMGGYSAGAINISGGNIGGVDGYHGSTTTIAGGNVGYAASWDTNATIIISGTIGEIFVHEIATVTITGGTLTKGLILYSSTAQVNFVGSALSYTYEGYGGISFGNDGDYGDFFRVSGMFNGTVESYNLYLYNANQDNPYFTPNPTPRQFTFNGAAPQICSK